MRDPSRFVIVPALLVVAGAACGESTGPDENEPVTLTVVSWGGAYQEAMTRAWFDPYVQAYPHVTLVQDEPTDYQALQAMVASDAVSWDVVDIENDFGLQGTEALLEPIDCVKVPCEELQPDRFRTTGYRVPVMLWGLVVAYRTDAWGGGEPQGWMDFFDLERFPGKRAIRRSGAGSGILEGALLADGVAAADLYPLDIERSLAKLQTIADEIVWWDDGQACPELLADGVAVMGLCYNGRVFDVQEQGHPLAIQWTGALIQADYLVVPRGSSNVEAAMDLIAWMTSAEHNASLSDFISYAPANALAVDMVDPVMEPHLPSTYADVTVARDDVWLDQNRDQIAQRFDEWLQENGG
jgi:putative spermidine/putrescine transport system substrate-binding protein